MVGRRMPSMRTTGRHIGIALGWLASASKALDELAKGVGCLAGQPVTLTNLRTRLNNWLARACDITVLGLLKNGH